ncbi:manganese transport system ATP-binding protein MntA [Synechococcus elongatus PCC 6301]|uniref:Manganese transport system ATP-binding protein MntA n=1 Tax=Synechococcus sp. (strain ATCC 27144 / PCC 6301 / SAUG 1402/1) TaxID=269084 RepID=A0A0H3JZL3_SYNP6|nr:metal ABC transporter ATP-binding protein [Synechococcus elongatus]BAD78426.1 manganese transport system ATP-binding protein MntA [Synechococcus elongatus PCC 6301]
MLEIQHLSVCYRQQRVLEDICLQVQAGEQLALIGPNGAGKSTLVRAILGLLTPYAGEVRWRGRPLRRGQRSIAYVPQRSQIDWQYPITVETVVRLGAEVRSWWGRSPQTGSRIAAALEQVQLTELRHRPLAELSGGQQQRVFLARAIAQGADLLLLNEPFTGIDHPTERLMQNLFQQFAQQGKTLIVCSHEWGDALQRYDRLILLNRRIICHDIPDRALTPQNLQQTFGARQPDAPPDRQWGFAC